jgi:Glycosyl hydrolase family 71
MMVSEVKVSSSRSLPCTSTDDANVIRQYVNTYANHPNQLFYRGQQVVSSFSGSDCTFGQSNINAAWNYAVKATAKKPVSHGLLDIPQRGSSATIMTPLQPSSRLHSFLRFSPQLLPLPRLQS